MNDKKKHKKEFQPVFKTFPLANNNSRDGATKNSEPSDDDVEAVKEWVEFNKK